jgi:hypothetical protein
VEYTEAAGKCDSLSDIPWASASPTSGSTIGGDSSLVDVTFDSTGLGPSVYTGTLCISSNDPVQSLVEVPMTMTVPIGYGVQLSADMAKSGMTGETVSYTVAITNTGNTTDTFDISASSIWTATPFTSSVTLVAFASTTFSVAVDIPAGAADGSSEVATITATSQSDALAADSIDLTTTAAWLRIYLPVLMKN